MSLQYIRKYYGVPAKLRQRVVCFRGKLVEVGKIIGTSGPHLRVQFADRKARIYHPTDVQYVPD